MWGIVQPGPRASGARPSDERQTNRFPQVVLKLVHGEVVNLVGLSKFDVPLPETANQTNSISQSIPMTQ
jgi:hypothetical protein